MDDTDPELMMRLARGEDDALNVLMRRWGKRVVAFLHRMTGRLDVAEDLAQETFVKLYQARGRYKASGQFSTWLFAIAANLGRNHARWLRRHPTVSMDDTDTGGEAWFPETADPLRAPDGMAIGNEIADTVNRAVLALPLDLREALTLFVHEDLGYADIAKILGCSTKAVETRIYRARQILKAKLANLRV
ncbi:MAG TPA: sigma-70 family RNA polymerase sigma factor [Luteolibacter sp.]|nr:sigma-70 family RNA polymerase sigma factor [Luteolibacter sp.]